jgi:hypothetical protein
MRAIERRHHLDILWNETQTFENFEKEQELKLIEEQKKDLEEYEQSCLATPESPKKKQYDLWRICEDGIHRRYVLKAWSEEDAKKQIKETGKGHRKQDDYIPCRKGDK